MAIDLDKLLPTIMGWCDKDKAQRMIDIIRETQPETVMEIGVYGGSSYICMALAVKENGHGLVVGIDPWDVSAALEGMVEPANLGWWGKQDLQQVYEHCQQQIAMHGLTEYCRLIRAKAEDAVIQFADNSIDVLHIDGNHSEEPAYKDATLYLPKVKPGGFLIFDDVWWTENQHVTTRKEVMYLLEHCDRVDMIDDCMLIQKR